MCGIYRILFRPVFRRLGITLVASFAAKRCSALEESGFTSQEAKYRVASEFFEPVLQEVPNEAIRYLNRISDALFVWSRCVNAMLGLSETLWEPNEAASGL